MTDSSISGTLITVCQEVPGWSPPDQLNALHALALATSHLSGDLLELGAWCGRSTVALGLAARATNSCVHSIDLFPERADWYQNPDGSYSFKLELAGQMYGGYQDQTVWREPFERDIEPVYRRFRSTLEAHAFSITRFGVAERVTAHRGTSLQLEESPLDEKRFRLAFIDGDHSREAVSQDIRRIAPKIVPGGWICFDDAFTSYVGVDGAIRELILGSDTFDLGTQMTRKMFVARKRSDA